MVNQRNEGDETLMELNEDLFDDIVHCGIEDLEELGVIRTKISIVDGDKISLTDDFISLYRKIADEEKVGRGEDTVDVFFKYCMNRALDEFTKKKFSKVEEIVYRRFLSSIVRLGLVKSFVKIDLKKYLKKLKKEGKK